MNNAKIIMCLGLPASGKSTWARRVVSEKGYKRVNKDDLRAMLDNNIFSKNNEDFTIAVRDYIVEQALSKNHTIIIDDTNLAVKHEERLREIAAEYSAVGEEGCEFMARTKKEVQAWIDREIAGEGHGDEPAPTDYYYIHAYTNEDLKSMKEV